MAGGEASLLRNPVRWRRNGSRGPGLVEIHYLGVRILFAVREGIRGGSRAVEAPVAFLSLGRRYLDGGCRS